LLAALARTGQYGVVRYGLRRYWFVFDLAPPPPQEGRGISLDGPSAWTPEARLRAGVGVTGIDEDDCRGIIEQRMLDGVPLPKVSRVIADVDVSTLGEHVLPNMEAPIDRGIWFPRGCL
jgi:hypothetical protein